MVRRKSTTSVLDDWAHELSLAGSADSSVYDALLQQLHSIDPGLYIEFCANSRPCELIITADGDCALFDLAQAIVATAPVIPGWTIRALKPKLGFPRQVRWRNFKLKVAETVFDPLEHRDSSKLGLRILIPGLAQEDSEDAHNAILRALDHGLGEQKLAESIGYTEVLPLPEGAARDDFIPLEQLESFIRWRDRRRTEGAGKAFKRT